MSADRLPLNDSLLDGALRDYLKSPGRYSIALREPRLLFEHSRAVLAVAAGRHSLIDGASASEASSLQQAARFFIRQAFLRQGADHYALLGVSPEADLQTIREHYRLLIRLTHPDFATATDAWPPNTAARVNLAYDVLSTPDKRSEYDVQPALQAQHAAERTAMAQPPQTAKANAPRPDKVSSKRKGPGEALDGGRARGAYFYGGLATFAVATMLAFLLISTPEEDASLRAAATPTPAPLSTPPSPLAVQTAVQDARSQESEQPAFVAALEPVQETPDEIPTRVSAKKHGSIARPSPATAPVATSAPHALAVQTTPPVTEELSMESVKLGLTRSLALPVTAHAQLSEPATFARPSPSPTSQPEMASQPEKPEAIAQNNTPATATLNMRTLQPLLASMVEAMQSGNSAQVQRWIERTATQSPSASAFASSYQAALGGGRVIGLGQVKFTPRAAGSPSQVDGTIHLNLEYADQQTAVKAFRLRAYFEGHPEAPKLSYLEAR